MTINKTTVILAIICAILVVLLFWKMCSPEPAITMNEYKDSALFILKLDKERSDSALRANSDSLFKVQQARRVDSARLVTLAEKLLKADATTKRLHTQYETLRQDRLIPLVIEEACDSLANQALINSALALGYKEAAEEQVIKYDREIKLKDSGQAILQRSLADQRAAFNLMQRAYDAAKPRTKVYAGLKAFGSRETLLIGGGITTLLVDKRGNAFNVGAGSLHTGNPYFEVGYSKLISFRRK